jgi:hypothetical protein
VAEPVRTPIPDNVVQRVSRSLGASVAAFRDAWFGPLNPPEPQVPSVEGRQFDFPAGFNLRLTPRETEPVTFGTMRALADSYDLLRLVIESRKDQLVRFEWGVRPTDATKKPDDRCKELERFFAQPDREHSWQDWLRAIVEEMLVTDAACLYPRRTKAGGVYAFELMDGATIKRVIDNSGRTPMPPLPAYQQILKGIPAVDYTRDELIYQPRNLRVWKVYGLSPVEQVITTVNIAMRRQVSQLSYYTHGSTPDLILSVPKEWTPEQIRTFQGYWDSLLSGNTLARAGTKFVPEGVSPLNTKDKVLQDAYDEWLARIICYAFSVSPQALLAMMNRATAEVAAASAMEEGLFPLLSWVKGLINRCIVQFWGYTDIAFQWDIEEKVSPREQAEIDEIYTRAKVKTPDEVRSRLNLDPLTPEERQRYWPGGVDVTPADDQDAAMQAPAARKLDALVYGGLEKKKRLLPS